MASQSNAKNVERNDIGLNSTTRIYSMNENRSMSNQASASRYNESELFIGEKLEPKQTGVTTKPKVTTEIEVGKLTDISSLKLRERLIHMLGFNSYTRKEILSILLREGLRSCERSVFDNVLKNIAHISQNVYNLRPNIWPEVNENWPYYTENELQQLKMRKEQNLRTPNSSGVVPSASVDRKSSTLNTTNTPQPAENNPLKGGNTSKRPIVANDEAQPTKKRCIDHTAIDNCADTLCTTLQPPATKISTDPYINTAKPTNYDFNDYTEITSLEQRQQYKDSFNSYSQEYMLLLQQSQELLRHFRELVEKIFKVPTDSDDYRRIEECLLAKYETLNGEEQLRREQRWCYLHDKLSHIKQLVTAFDRKCLEAEALSYAMAMAKEYRLTQQQLKATTAFEEDTSRPAEIPITNGDGAKATIHLEIPASKEEYISDILAEDLDISDDE